MTIAIIPLIIAALGLALYGLANGKASTVGLWMFIVGLLALVFTLSGHWIRIV